MVAFLKSFGDFVFLAGMVIHKHTPTHKITSAVINNGGGKNDGLHMGVEVQ
jgi:hypothetical protein